MFVLWVCSWWWLVVLSILMMGLVGFLGIHRIHFDVGPVWVDFYILYYGIECMLYRLLYAWVCYWGNLWGRIWIYLVPFRPIGRIYLFYLFVVICVLCHLWLWLSHVHMLQRWVCIVMFLICSLGCLFLSIWEVVQEI